MEVSSDRFSEEFYVRSTCTECFMTKPDRKCTGCEVDIMDFTVLPREEK